MRSAIITLSLFLIIFNSFALPGSWYHKAPLIDVPTHIAFGMLIGLFVISFNGRSGSKPSHLAIILGATLAVGLAWELLEFLRDTYYAIPRGLPPAQLSFADTIKDLVNNLIGGVLAYVLVFHIFPERSLKKIKGAS